MENPEEILHSLEEFSKLRPKDIPRELEEYLCFVAKTGDPIYQWSSVKSLFREKLINVITEFYESCPSVEIPPCPNVDVFNYEIMKNFILEKLDTFAAAPFTVQRICELLTTPRKEYNRIDKYMRALEKNILVVSTTEPGNRRSAENGENIMNGLDSENGYDTNNDINVEEMDDVSSWPRLNSTETITYQAPELNEPQTSQPVEIVQETFISESTSSENACTSTVDTVIAKSDEPYVSIEPIESDTCTRQESVASDVSVTITAIPAVVQKRRDSIEPVVSSEQNEQILESASSSCEKDNSPLLNKEEEEADSNISESEAKPPVNEDSSVSTSEVELNDASCSEVSNIYVPSTSEDPPESQSAASSSEQEEVQDSKVESAESCENNFVIASSVDEDISSNNEVLNPEPDDNSTSYSAKYEEEKTDLVSSREEINVDSCTVEATTENKPTEESKEETIEEKASSVSETDETVQTLESSEPLEDAPIEKDEEESESKNVESTTDMSMEVDVLEEPKEEDKPDEESVL